MDSFIYDFETLSQDTERGVILSVAMFAFNTERFNSRQPYTFDEILAESRYYKYDTKEQIKVYHRQIDDSTLEWWKQQSPEAVKSQLMPKESDLSIANLPEHFRENLPTSKRFNVYTRGNTFDPILLQYVCKQMGEEYPYPWWAERDLRSLFDGFLWGSGFTNRFNPYEDQMKDLPLHDPRVDIALDVMRFQYILEKISPKPL